MTTGSTGVTLGEAVRRLEQAEKQVEELRKSHQDGTFISASQIEDKLALLRQTIRDANEDISTIRREDTQKRLLLYGAVVAALASLVATIILGGGFS